MINNTATLEYSKNLTLLYVEDDLTTRIITLVFLEKKFKNIIIAVDGQDGLDKFLNNKIDIVITDIDMPIMDGLEMSKHIKKVDKTTPILIFSSGSNPEVLIDAIHTNVDGYLIKPIQKEQFFKALKKSLKDLQNRDENIHYKNTLERMVEKKVLELREKDYMLLQQSRMATMGEIIDAIAHQWRQPLNSISMQQELISIDINNGVLDKENIKNAIDITTMQIEYLTDTMKEFRTFFRPKHNIEKLNMQAILSSIKVLLKDELLKNTIELNLECHQEITIEANANDIKHLLINLINNAKDEMVKNNIKSADKKIQIECFQDEDSTTIFVKDNGLGIPENIKNEIFKANFSTKKNIGGTGIGLYMCKQIVHKYSGEITVENSQSGAIFKIVLKH